MGAAGPGGHILEELRPHRPELLRQDGEFSRLTIISCPSVVLLRILFFFKTINYMIRYYGAHGKNIIFFIFCQRLDRAVL